MFHNTQEAVENFLASHYTEQLSQTYRNCLALMDTFEYATIYEKLIDVIFDPESENQDKASMDFHTTMVDGLNAVLSEHMLSLTEEATIVQRMYILHGLYLLQSIEDPVPYLRMLESVGDEAEVFGRIIGQLTELTATEVMLVLDEAMSNLPGLLTGIKNMLTDMENIQPVEVDEVAVQVTKNLNDYFKACGEDNLACQLVNSGMTIGQSAAIYYPYVSDHLVTENDEETAKNLLSFFLFCRDTYQSPLESYRKYSEALLGTAARTSRIEAIILQEYTKLEQYKDAQTKANSIQNTNTVIGAKP